MTVENFIHIKRVFMTDSGLTPNLCMLPTNDYDDLCEIVVGDGPIVIAGVRCVEAPGEARALMVYAPK